MKLVNQKEGIYQSFKKKRGGGGGEKEKKRNQPTSRNDT